MQTSETPEILRGRLRNPKGNGGRERRAPGSSCPSLNQSISAVICSTYQGVTKMV